MTGQLHRSKRYISSATAALLFGLSCSAAIASDAIERDCVTVNKAPDGVEIPAPSLSVELLDHGLTDSAADMKSPAANPAVEKLTSPALAVDATETSITENDDAPTTSDRDSAAAADDLPETALRLPGVSDEELPKFRRQMYRTDI